MNPIKTNQYRCGECGDRHCCEEDAIMCCAPEAIGEPAWQCAECGNIYSNEDEARYCCLDEEIVLPATHAQLEAAGQERLAL